MKDIRDLLLEARMTNLQKLDKELSENPNEYKIVWTKFVGDSYSKLRLVFNNIENFENFEKEYKEAFNNDVLPEKDINVIKHTLTSKFGSHHVCLWIDKYGNKEPQNRYKASFGPKELGNYKLSIKAEDFNWDYMHTKLHYTS